jgi:hypothetical protein
MGLRGDRPEVKDPSLIAALLEGNQGIRGGCRMVAAPCGPEGFEHRTESFTDPSRTPQSPSYLRKRVLTHHPRTNFTAAKGNKKHSIDTASAIARGPT